MTLPDPNAQTPPPAGNGQAELQTQLAELSAKIANGEYVPKQTYVGLQQTHEKQVLAHKADKDALVAAQTKAQEMEAALRTLQTQYEGDRNKLTATESEKATLQQNLERTKLIMAKFPHLASFEADGLLPQAPVTELESILSIFSSKLGANAQAAKETHIAGATQPPAGPNQAEPTAKQLLDQANQFAREGKFVEYNKAMDGYLAAVNKEQASTAK